MLSLRLRNSSNARENSRNMRKMSQKFRPKLANDVTEAIGNVPTVRLNHIASICRSHELYLKLEACNPGGSIKEKNAVYLNKLKKKVF